MLDETAGPLNISVDRHSILITVPSITLGRGGVSVRAAPPTTHHSAFFCPAIYDNESLPVRRYAQFPPRHTESAYKYKKVADRIKPVPTTLPEDYRITRIAHPDPLKDLTPLPEHPPDYTPGKRFTQERHDELNIDPAGFLLPDERALAVWIIRQQEDALAWDELEKGALDYDYFAPVLIPTIEHIPWVLKNIPIPPGIFPEVVKIIKDKINSGVYEPSNSSYRSRWFCVVKKDGKSLRLVHDLQPLNAVSIRDPSVPYPTEHIAEGFGGRACYTTLDLFVAFDQRKLAIRSRDLTTFQTPLGAYRLTSIPMGYTNSQQIMHADITFILQDEIPDVAFPYIDDIPIKGPATRYKLPDGSYETIPANPGIRRFIWEHLNDVHRILYRLKIVGATLSGKKLVIAAPEAVIIGHTCNYSGRILDLKQVHALMTWPPLENISQTRAFLGSAGVLRHFINDFARLASGVTRLLKKDQPFEFGPDAQNSMAALKKAASDCGAIRPLDYECDRPVHLCVDSSIIGYGAILLQLGENGEHFPARFMSGTWNARERNYSQPKIELFGLFRALYEARIYLIGLKHFFIEVDAKYIKGMINNPDLQPNATINRWIAGILLFSFTLIHIPADRHTGPDGLSRRDPHADDPERDERYEDWIDKQYAFLGVSSDHIPRRLTTDPDATTIPRSEAAQRADEELEEIKQFLVNPTRESSKTDNQFRQFVSRATRFFVDSEKLFRKGRGRPHQLVLKPESRLAILRTAHDELGHKGFFTVRNRVQDRFWWPMMNGDIHWFIRTCHDCQVRQFTHVHILPSVPTPAPLFARVHLDVMVMPKSGPFKYIVQARDSLTAYPEFRMLRADKATAIADFIFQDIISRWGCVHEIVSDNGSSFIAAIPPLLEKYNIHHVRISPYNSRANGIVERRHLDLREALMKMCGGNPAKWSQHAYHAIWAERVTIQRSTGYSPYFMVHGVQPVLPFDLAEQTYISPTYTSQMTQAELLAARGRALQRCPDDLRRVRESVLRARFKSIREFEKRYQNTIRDYNFGPGALVLVRNSHIEMELNRKAKPKYIGPMVVVRRTIGGSYILAELTGAISTLRFAAFRVIPYHARTTLAGSVETLVGRPQRELDELSNEEIRTHDRDGGSDEPSDASSTNNSESE